MRSSGVVGQTIVHAENPARDEEPVGDFVSWAENVFLDPCIDQQWTNFQCDWFLITVIRNPRHSDPLAKSDDMRLRYSRRSRGCYNKHQVQQLRSKKHLARVALKAVSGKDFDHLSASAVPKWEKLGKRSPLMIMTSGAFWALRRNRNHCKIVV